MSDPANRRSRRVEFEGGNGFQLEGILDSPTDQPVAALLFSHCFTCGKDLKMTVRLSRALAEIGICVLRYDMSGIGGSAGEFSESNFRSNVADLKAASAFLAAQNPGPQFLLGHSFGGAASLAATMELQVQGTITLAAPSDTSHLADVLSRMNPKIESDGEGDVVIGGRKFTIRKQMLDDFRSFDLPSEINQINKPLLAIHSPKDATVAFWHASKIVPNVDSGSTRNAELQQRSLISLPGSDHLLTNHPGDIPFVASIIGSWINRHMPAS